MTQFMVIFMMFKIIKDDYNNLVNQFADRFYEVSMLASSPCLPWASAAQNAVYVSGWSDDEKERAFKALDGERLGVGALSWAYGVGLDLNKWTLDRIQNWILSGVKETCDGTGCESLTDEAPEVVDFEGQPPGHTIVTPDGTTYTLNASGYVTVTSVNQNYLISPTTPGNITWFIPT